MRHLDLFSGIGGFALAASWVWGDEHEIVSFCDNDKAAQCVLKKHWPGVPIRDDIKALDATKWWGTVDLVTGGFPCQPFSCAGKRKGKTDDRYLWPQMLRVIEECQPRWVLAENVPGIINMELDSVLDSLEGAGYETGTLIIPACAVDAPHIRSRIWIVACNQGRRGGGIAREMDATSSMVQGRQTEIRSGQSTVGRCRQDVADARCGCNGTNEQEHEFGGGNKAAISTSSEDVADAPIAKIRRGHNEISTRESHKSFGFGKCSRWLPEPDVGRVADGVPFRVDRLRLLGNAIVPQVAAQIFRAMKEHE